MRGIFISYRRDDSEGQAGRLFDDLSAHFGRNAVFMDVAGIKKGLDFRRIIDAHVASCGVLLVIIGKRWLSATDSKGRRRLDDVNDFVCLETAAALSRDIPVVPVLVQDAVMPSAQDLPDALKELAFRNGTELTHARWDSDVKLLIEDLRPYLEEPTTAAIASQPVRDESSSATSHSILLHDGRSLRRSLGAAAGLAVIIGGISIFGYHLLQDRPAAPSQTLAVAPTPPATQPHRLPEHTAPPPIVAKLPLEAGDDLHKRDLAAAQADAAKAAAAKAAAARAAAEAAAARAVSARAAAARRDADEARRRAEIERSTQLAEEQRKRDDDARRIAQAQAEQQRIAAEQAAAARMFTDIATAVLGSRQHNRR